MISFQCPKCPATLKAPIEKIGARSKCPKCGCPVQVPRQPGSIAPAVVTEVLPVKSRATIPEAPDVAKVPPEETPDDAPASTLVRDQGETGLLALLAVILIGGGSVAFLVYAITSRPSAQPSSPRIVGGAGRLLTPARAMSTVSMPKRVRGAFALVNIREIQNAYRSNEAAADAKYLNKKVQFEFRSLRVDLEPGGYCVWSNQLGISAG